MWAPLLGQEAAQVGAGRAPGARGTWPSRPTASTASRGAVESTRPSCSGLFRGTDAGRLGSKEPRFHRTRSSSATRAATPSATRWVQRFDGVIGRGGTTDEATMVFFGDGATSQGDVPEGFVYATVYDAPVVFYCQNNQWAISEPLEQADPGTAVPSRRAASASPACGSTATTCSPAGRQPVGAGGVPRPATGRSSSRPSPTGWTPTPRPTTPPGTDPPRPSLEAQGPDRAGAAAPVRATVWLTTSFVAEVDAEAAELARRLRQGCRALPDPSPSRDVRPRLRRTPPVRRPRSGQYMAPRRLAGFADTAAGS